MHFFLTQIYVKEKKRKSYHIISKLTNISNKIKRNQVIYSKIKENTNVFKDVQEMEIELNINYNISNIPYYSEKYIIPFLLRKRFHKYNISKQLLYYNFLQSNYIWKFLESGQFTIKTHRNPLAAFFLNNGFWYKNSEFLNRRKI